MPDFRLPKRGGGPHRQHALRDVGGGWPLARQAGPAGETEPVTLRSCAGDSSLPGSTHFVAFLSNSHWERVPSVPAPFAFLLRAAGATNHDETPRATTSRQLWARGPGPIAHPFRHVTIAPRGETGRAGCSMGKPTQALVEPDPTDEGDGVDHRVRHDQRHRAPP